MQVFRDFDLGLSDRYYVFMSKNTIRAEGLIPLRDTVFVTDLDSGDKLTRGGIIVVDDNMRERGIRDRWARVYAVGPDVDDLTPGEWVLVSHGRWTPGMDVSLPDGDVKLWRIEYPEAVLLVSEDDPRDSTTIRF